MHDVDKLLMLFPTEMIDLRVGSIDVATVIVKVIVTRKCLYDSAEGSSSKYLDLFAQYTWLTYPKLGLPASNS